MRTMSYAVALLVSTSLAGAGVTAAAMQAQQGTQQQSKLPPAGIEGATVEKIADNPKEWYGKKVRVRAEIGDVFSRTVFNVEEEGLIDVDDEVLIVMPKGKSYMRADQKVTVTGKVHEFIRADLETTYRDIDWDLAPDLLLQFERRPVIVAESVQMSPEKR